MSNSNNATEDGRFGQQQQSTAEMFDEAVKQFEMYLISKYPSLSGNESLAYTNPLVFYPNDVLADMLKKAREMIEAELLSKIEKYEKSEVMSLRNDLYNLLQPIEVQYLEKNKSVRKTAEDRAQVASESFLKEYLVAMQKYFNRLKKMTTGMLEEFSNIELEKVGTKFMDMNLGPLEFQHEWLGHLKDMISMELKPMRVKVELEHTILLSISQFEMEIRRVLKVNDSLEGDELTKLLKSTEQRIFLQHRDHLEKKGASKEVSAQYSESFHLKVKESIEKFRNDNDKRQSMATLEAEKLMENCISVYESTFPQNVDSLEELNKFRDKEKSVVEKFLEETKLRNKNLLDQFVQRLTIRTNQISEKAQKFIEMKIQAEDDTLFSASQKIQKVYKNHMDKHFSKNKTGYFDPDVLDMINMEIQQTAIEKFASENPLTSNQTKKIEEHLEKLYEKYKEQNNVNKHSFNNNDAAIGIDLGTTYCCVAIYHMGQVKIIRNSLGDNTTPSYVTIDSNGSYVVGKTAKDKSYRNPANTVYDAKRILGRRLDDEKLRADLFHWPFVVEEKDSRAQIKVHDKFYHPEQIMAMILKYLKLEAQEIMGFNINKAVITVPAYFTDGQRQATVDAGEMAGLEVLGILNEPTAAAVAYRLEWYASGKPRKILIYDLGGGTFDVAVLEISTEKIDVLSISGDSQLGGEDFDKIMMDYCIEEFKTETGINLLEGKFSPEKRKHDETKRSIKRLQLNCEIAKKQLSTARATTISIDEIVRGEDMNVDIRREKFVEMNAAFFRRTIEIVDEALQSAGIRKDAIDDIILIGGSTRIRKLQQMLDDHFGGQKINKKINPDEAVAYGAAVQAAILNASPGTTLFDFGKIQEITPMSLGIEVVTREMDVLIPKNTKYPARLKHKYRTNRNGQTTASIRIFQGEHSIAQKNKLLGNFDLEGIPPGPAGAELVDVTMVIDRNGILSVEAVCKSTSGKNCITVNQQKGRLGEEEKRKFMRNV